MQYTGEPFSIQNTDGPYWYVSWANAVNSSTEETVSFTVRIPRSANLTLEDVQKHAMKRAEELLQAAIRATSDQ